MSTTIDHRVIQMKFDNDEFEKRSAKTLSTLAELKSKMNFDGATKGLTDLNAASRNFSLEGIGRGVEDIKNKFSALSVVGITALANIANRAINAGLQIVKSLTIAPIGQGFADYNTKLTSVQTIMNATGADINKVNGYFNQLDTYADKTIYNLTDMTSAFAKFTNAGIPMEKSVPAIKGIANMTALAGQGAESAQIAYYNLSQSLAGGFLTTIDYKSLNLANVATVEWKKQVIDGAIAAGTLKKNSKGMYNTKGSKNAYTMQSLFTEGLKDQWATTDVLTKVLGDYGNTQTAIGKKAQAAAQNVKSLPMMMTTLKESVGTGWTQSFEYIFGNVNESTKLFTGMTNAIQGVLNKASFSRNHMLHQWKDLGGRTAIIDSVANTWKALGAIVKPIGDAFREVFPPGAGKALADMSFKLREFTKHLMIGGDTAQRIKSTFEGVFGILKIGTMIVSGIVKALFRLFSTASAGTGGVLAVTATFGEFIRKISDLLTKTGAIDKFFTALVSPLILIKPLISLVSNLAGAFSMLFTGNITGFVSRFKSAFDIFGTTISGISDKFSSFLLNIENVLSNVNAYFMNLFRHATLSGNTFVAGIAKSLAGAARFVSNFVENVRQILMHLTDAFTSVTSGGKNFLADFGGNTLQAIIKVVEGMTGRFKTLKAVMHMGDPFSNISKGASLMKDNLSQLSTVGSSVKKASGEIGGGLSSIGNSFAPILAGLRDFFTTLVQKITEFVKNLNFQDVLALIDTGVFMLMYRSVTRISNSIAQTFEQLTNTLKSMQQNVRANVVLKIAIAVGILAASVLILSRIDPKALAIALGGLTALFIQIGIMLKVITKINPKRIASAGTGLVLMATAIRILVGAIQVMGNMSLGSLIQGMISLGVIFGLLAVAMNTMKTALPGATAVLLIATALAVLTPVLLTLGLLPYEVIYKGIGTVAAALALLVAASNAMTTALPGASAILIIAAAIAILTPALIGFGLMPWGNILKAMVVLAATLTMLVIAANSMTAALPGAAAILIMAGALALLAPALVLFGMMKWEGIAKGLVMLAGVFAIFVIAMYALTPVIVVLSLFSGALLIMGAGLLLAGAGMLLFSTALTALSISGAAGFVVLMTGIHAFLAMLPLIAQQFGLALVAFAKVITLAAPKLIAAFVLIILEMLKGLNKIAPQLISTIGRIVILMIQEIAKRVPQMAAAGLDMIIGLLKAIKSRISEITNLAIDIVVLFIKTLAGRLPNIIRAGIELIISFLNGLAEGLRSHKKEMADAGANIGSAIVEGLVAGLAKGKDLVIDAAKKLASHLPSWVKKVLGISSPSKEFEKIGIFVSEGLVKGLKGSRDQVQTAFDHLKDVIRSAKDSAAKDMTDLQTKLSKLNAKTLADDKAIAKQRQVLADAQNRSEKANANGKALTEAQRQAFDESKSKAIQTAKDKLEKLTEARHKDNAAIAAATKALAEARNEHTLSSAAYQELTQRMGANVRQLQSLSDQLEANKTKIDEANKALDDAIKTRDDYKKSIADSFDALPDINKDTTLADYVDSLQAKKENVVAFSTALDELRSYGLSDQLYQEFLKKGVDTLPFIEEVIKGGKASVELINQSSANLATAASALGTVAANSMYQAGVDTAQGLLDGLKSKEAELQDEMARIAAIIAQTAKDKLKIKSPSQVFMKIGAYTAEGLAKGMKDNSFLAENVAGDIGQNVVDALTKTISNMSDLVPMNMDLQPTITPILDLSNVKKNAGLLNGMLPSQQLNVESAYSRARAANAGYAANQETVVPIESVDSLGNDVIFNQYITSPKAVSTADVYRNTRNQISQAKGALTGAKPN